MFLRPSAGLSPVVLERLDAALVLPPSPSGVNVMYCRRLASVCLLVLPSACATSHPQAGGPPPKNTPVNEARLAANHAPVSHTAGSPTSPRAPRRTHRRLGSGNSSTSAISSSSTTPARTSPSGRPTDQRRRFHKRRCDGQRRWCASFLPRRPDAVDCGHRIAQHGRCDAVPHAPRQGSMLVRHLHDATAATATHATRHKDRSPRIKRPISEKMAY